MLIKALDEYIREIAWNSQTLYERLLYASDENTTCEADMKIAEQRLAMWKEYAAANDSIAFSKRLLWDNIDQDTALRILSDSKPPKLGQQVSKWMTLLYEVLEQVGDINLQELHQSAIIYRDEWQPFEEIHFLFVNIAVRKLNEKNIDIDSVLKPNAFKNLVCLLFSRLRAISNDVFMREFELKHKELEDSKQSFEVFWTLLMTDALFGNLDNYQTTIQAKEYGAFIEKLIGGEILEVFKKYPVMARLMAQFTLFWVDFTADIINALSKDINQISTTFFCGEHLGRVEVLEGGLSDPHHEGRSVVKLEFESKQKLIYKPRDLGIEESFFNFANWMNQVNNEEMFKTLKIINKGTYGWVEYCEHIPCKKEQEVKRFFERSGMLAGLFYLLSGCDFHNENIIAQGEYPVPIDIEVILQPKPTHTNEYNNEYSVIDTSLLPTQFFKGKNGYFSIEGIGGGHAEDANDKALSKGCVYLDGRLAKPQDYLSEIESGFKKIYSLVLILKDELLSEKSYLNVFKNKKIRYVYRKTDLYFILLQNAARPKYMGNGIFRSIRLDKISRPLLVSGETPIQWDIIRMEHNAFDVGDIPIFYVGSDSRSLKNEYGVTIEEFFVETPIEKVKNILLKMSSSDMEKQCAIIRECYKANHALRKEIKEDYSLDVKYKKDSISLRQEDVVEVVTSIAQYICENAIISEEGMTWINAVEDSNSGITLKSIKNRLYNGNLGIYLFLSAYSKVFGDKTDNKLINSRLESLTKAILEYDWEEIISETRNIGAGKGIGGTIYFLVKLFESTGNTDLLHKALKLSEMISESLIAKDLEYDVMSGSAGAILGLLALYEVSSENKVIDGALKCGEHLLKSRIEDSNCVRAWKSGSSLNADNGHMIGFLCGSSGIAYALLNLYRVSGQQKYLDAVRESILFENSMFQKDSCNSISIDRKDYKCPNSYGNGLAGVYLNRLEANDVPELQVSKNVGNIIYNKIKNADNCFMDNLSQGNFGRIDVLITASKRLEDDELYNEALKRVENYVENFKYSGTLGNTYSFPCGIYDLSFLNGISGIGYVLLRILDNSLPSILAFE